MGEVFAPIRFSFVRTSIRDLVAERERSLVRNSGVGGRDQNRFLRKPLFFGGWGEFFDYSLVKKKSKGRILNPFCLPVTL